MFTEFPIADLIARRKAELRLSSADIVRGAGYRSVNSGLRRLDDLCHGDLSDRTKFLRDGLPIALDLSADQVTDAIEATERQLAEEERARIEEEERGYRAAFRPHVLWVGERLIPRPIFIAAFLGVENLLRFDLDMEQGEETFVVAQAIAAKPSWAGPFGKVVGFHINYTPDRCVEYDAQGNVLGMFSKARRPGRADFTLKGGRSILPLFGLKAPERYER
jgi:hypothetical protein